MMNRFASAVCGLVFVGVLLGAAWGWEANPGNARLVQDRLSSEEDSPDKEYWAVCCRYIARTRGLRGGFVHCSRCTVGPIDADYLSRLPTHCRWFKQREQAEDYFHKRHTCP
ncbi:MAG: hypothetical protein AB1646_04195 [Thermodesulfobacteriota bacterium]